MAQFYDRLSLESPNTYGLDDATEHFFKAIDFLTLATLTTQCMEDNKLRYIITSELDANRDYFLNLKKHMTKKAWDLHQAIEESTSECEDEALAAEITSYVYAMAEHIEIAEKSWTKSFQ